MKTLYFAIFFFFLVIGTRCKICAQGGDFQPQFFWEITGQGIEEPCYLLGSIHVSDERAFRFQDSVLIALDQCKVFATEVHLDTLFHFSISDFRKKIMTREFQERIDSQQKEDAFRDFLDNNGVPGKDIQQIQKPWYIDPFIRSQKYKGDYRYPVFLDAWLFGKAAEHGKVTVSLELLFPQLLRPVSQFGSLELAITPFPLKAFAFPPAPSVPPLKADATAVCVQQAWVSAGAQFLPIPPNPPCPNYESESPGVCLPCAPVPPGPLSPQKIAAR